MIHHYKDFKADYEHEAAIIDLLLIKLAKPDKLIKLLAKNCLEKISHNKFFGYASQIERIVQYDVSLHSPTQLVHNIQHIV